ncbi:TonB-dependent receptor [Teredinibacter haidensis]|uniref:TonB-dependent receptor n=1 Tax=Teredinibacter haidensis TaxID=2731755 RepID=UPI000948D2C3|nr:TonB-dependent receptor [Teredinibacter haidensis]
MKLKNSKNIDKTSLFCASLLSLSISNVLAQEANPDDADEYATLEEVFVTGYVSSLKKGIEIKRSSDSIVDAIEAEDLGKFPDANVAESLQRVTGVAIDRSGGEGNKVSVRGLGPEFNIVTLNNRVLPNPDGARSFSFDVLASEMISGAEVYKTSQAGLSDGGIGAVINVSTFKPLNLTPGLSGAASIKGMHEELTEEITPQFSGLVNYTNDDRTFGVVTSIAYQKRDARFDEASTSGGWVQNSFDLDGNGASELQAWAPKGIGYRVELSERERTSGLVVAQWAPDESLTLTADLLYSEYEIQSDKNQVAHWWATTNNNTAGPGSVKVDEDGTVVFWQGHAAPTEFVHSTSNRPTTTYMSGFNVEKVFDNDSALTLDVSHAKAKNDAGGTQSYAVSGFRNTTESSSIFEIRPGDTVPSLTFPTFDPDTDSYTDEFTSNPPELTDAALLGNHFMVVEGDDNEDTINAVTLDWNMPLEWSVVSAVKAGTFFSDREFQRTRLRSSDMANNGTSTGFNDDIPDSIGTLVTVDNFLPNATGNFPLAWLTTDNQALRDYYESADFVKNGEFYNQRVDENGDPIAALDYTPNVELSNSPGVSEEKMGLYVAIDLEGEIADKSWSGNFGIRAVETNQVSSGWGEEILSIEPNPDDPTISIVTKDVAKPMTVSNDYVNVLPSFNFKLDLLNDVDVRFAASQTITRPELGRVGVDAGINTRPGAFSISGGNPYLKPYKSTNFDLAVNYYMNDSAYFGVAYMDKSIADFITTASLQTVIAGEDFVETRPFNVEEASIQGLEIATHYLFESLPGLLSGLGVQFNYTFVDSDSDYRQEEGSGVFGIEGLSDTANFIASYEYGPVQFRASYNWRDKFLSTVSNGEMEPVYVGEYGQWDMSFSYAINEIVTVFGEGINVTGEANRSYVRIENRLQDYTYTGTRLAIGVRAKF